MTITSQQIAHALIAEHSAYLADCPDDDDMSLSDYTDYIHSLSYNQLVDETSTDASYTLQEFINVHS